MTWRSKGFNGGKWLGREPELHLMLSLVFGSVFSRQLAFEPERVRSDTVSHSSFMYIDYSICKDTMVPQK